MILGTLETLESPRGVIVMIARDDQDLPDIRVRLRRPVLQWARRILGALIWSTGFIVFWLALGALLGLLWRAFS